LTVRNLVIIGDGSTLEMAVAIANRTRQAEQVAVERLAPQDIASNALSCLDALESDNTEVFATTHSTTPDLTCGRSFDCAAFEPQS
jgi:hypothetical protein